MAYLKKLRSCDESGCGRVATYELVGRANESYGKFCDPHARARLGVIKAVEQAEDRLRDEERDILHGTGKNLPAGILNAKGKAL